MLRRYKLKTKIMTPSDSKEDEGKSDKVDLPICSQKGSDSQIKGKIDNLTNEVEGSNGIDLPRNVQVANVSQIQGKTSNKRRNVPSLLSQ